MAWWRGLFAEKAPREPTVDDVNRFRAKYLELGEDDLETASRAATSLPEVIAVTAVVAARVLGLDMFDVQLRGALALAGGRIAEMQTGEGKTLAAVPAVVWYARSGDGVHVLTANDYLAGRDAAWMQPIYSWFGLSAGALRQGMSADERRAAYRSDVTYATANEIGFVTVPPRESGLMEEAGLPPKQPASRAAARSRAALFHPFRLTRPFIYCYCFSVVFRTPKT